MIETKNLTFQYPVEEGRVSRSALKDVNVTIENGNRGSAAMTMAAGPLVRVPAFQSACSACRQQALIGPNQATGFAGGFDRSDH